MCSAEVRRVCREVPDTWGCPDVLPPGAALLLAGVVGRALVARSCRHPPWGEPMTGFVPTRVSERKRSQAAGPTEWGHVRESAVEAEIWRDQTSKSMGAHA